MLNRNLKNTKTPTKETNIMSNKRLFSFLTMLIACFPLLVFAANNAPATSNGTQQPPQQGQKQGSQQDPAYQQQYSQQQYPQQYQQYPQQNQYSQQQYQQY